MDGLEVPLAAGPPLDEMLLAGDGVLEELVSFEVSLLVSTSTVDMGLTSTTVPFRPFKPMPTGTLLLGLLLLSENPRCVLVNVVLTLCSDAVVCMGFSGAMICVEGFTKAAASFCSLKHIAMSREMMLMRGRRLQ